MKFCTIHSPSGPSANPHETIVYISLDMLICQLMEKDPNDRPLNAAKVANELESVERRVVDQTSAGVERAAKRRADRTSLDRALDVTDKEAARVLLGKKKKRKTQPFYTENWFTLSALAGVALAAILFIYFTFLKAPGADELYLRADRLMLSTKPDDHKAAREPVNLFLFYYPNEVRAAKVKGWRELAPLVGRRIHVAEPGGTVEGEVVDLDDDGALRIRRDDGTEHRVVAGDVTVLGGYARE